jgi:hypothetical protein
MLVLYKFGQHIAHLKCFPSFVQVRLGSLPFDGVRAFYGVVVVFVGTGGAAAARSKAWREIPPVTSRTLAHFPLRCRVGYAEISLVTET